MAHPGLMRKRLYEHFCTGISLAINVGFSIVMGYLVKNEPDAEQALAYLIYMSVGTSLFILGHAGYAHFHPAKRPHSLRSSVIYTVFFGAVWIFTDLCKRR